MSENKQTQQASPPINVEDIMRELRAQIAAQTAGQLSSEFYDALYEAERTHAQIRVPIHVAKSSWPLIGPLVDKLRYPFHQLVMYYVDRMAVQQIAFNKQLLRAVHLLSEEIVRERRAREKTE